MSSSAIIPLDGVAFEVTLASSYNAVTDTSVISVQVVGVGEIITPAVVSTVTTQQNNYEEGETIFFSVTLNKTTSQPQTLSHALGGSANTGDYLQPLFTNNVTLVGNTLNIPAGVTNFMEIVSLVKDGLAEEAETLSLTVGGVSKTITIGSSAAAGANSVVKVTDASGNEGAILAHRVTMSTLSTVSLAFSLIHQTTSGADIGTPTFTNGVVLSGGVLIVPSNVSFFDILVTTVNDIAVEGIETYTISVAGVTATGTIGDDDAGAGFNGTIIPAGTTLTVPDNTTYALPHPIIFETGASIVYGVDALIVPSTHIQTPTTVASNTQAHFTAPLSFEDGAYLLFENGASVVLH